MHKRKDYYHAGGYNGKGLKKEVEEWNKPILFKNVKAQINPQKTHNQPPDNKPNLFKRIALFFKGRTEAQEG